MHRKEGPSYFCVPERWLGRVAQVRGVGGRARQPPSTRAQSGHHWAQGTSLHLAVMTPPVGEGRGSLASLNCLSALHRGAGDGLEGGANGRGLLGRPYRAYGACPWSGKGIVLLWMYLSS